MLSRLKAFYRVLVIVQLPTTCGGGKNFANIAYNKPAIQFPTVTYSKSGLGMFMSEVVRGSADKAVDGRKSILEGSCTHTGYRGNTKSEHWWQVDLQKHYAIENIKILNRQKFAERLHDVRIDVFDSPPPQGRKHCITHDGPAPRGWLSLSCEGYVTGRYVRISKPRNRKRDVLTLCEVEIYGNLAFMVFVRVSNTVVRPKEESLTVKSAIHCAIICLETEVLDGFIVKGKADENTQCQMVVHQSGKEDKETDDKGISFVSLL